MRLMVLTLMAAALALTACDQDPGTTPSTNLADTTRGNTPDVNPNIPTDTSEQTTLGGCESHHWVNWVWPGQAGYEATIVIDFKGTPLKTFVVKIQYAEEAAIGAAWSESGLDFGVIENYGLETVIPMRPPAWMGLFGEDFNQFDFIANVATEDADNLPTAIYINDLWCEPQE